MSTVKMALSTYSWMAGKSVNGLHRQEVTHIRSEAASDHTTQSQMLAVLDMTSSTNSTAAYTH
jgi:hypothetical protein